MLLYKKNNQQQQQKQKNVKMFWNKGDKNGITLKSNMWNLIRFCWWKKKENLSNTEVIRESEYGLNGKWY